MSGIPRITVDPQIQTPTSTLLPGSLYASRPVHRLVQNSPPCSSNTSSRSDTPTVPPGMPHTHLGPIPRSQLASPSAPETTPQSQKPNQNSAIGSRYPSAHARS